MKETLGLLYKLQDIDMKIDLANSKLESMDGAADIKKKYAAAKKLYEKTDNDRKSIEVEAKKCETELGVIEEKRKKQEKRVYDGSVHNQKELQAIQKEIEQLKKRQSELDGQALELMGSVEEKKAELEKINGIMEQAATKARERMKKEEANRQKIDEAMVKLQPARKKLADKITDMQLFSRYEGIRKSTGGSAIAKIVDNKCEACHMTVSPTMRTEANSGKDLVICDNCSRILMGDES